MSDFLDWNDPAAVRRWLSAMRSSFADADAVTSDLLRPPRSRDLGPIQHTRLYTEARTSILQLLAHATPPDPPIH